MLLLTPLTNQEIVLGKFVGVLRRCGAVWLLLLAYVASFTYAGFFHPLAVLQMAVVIGTILPLLVAAGFYFGLRLRTTTEAVTANLALAGALWCVLPLFASAVEHWMRVRWHWTSSAALVMVPFAQVFSMMHTTLDGRAGDIPWPGQSLSAWEFTRLMLVSMLGHLLVRSCSRGGRSAGCGAACCDGSGGRRQMMGHIPVRLRAVLDPAWLTGPIFGKELRVASRRRRQYVLRFLYILALTVFVGVVWLGVVQYERNAVLMQSRMAAAGQRIVTTIVLFQFAAMQILAIVLLSSAISDEVYHRTLGILMTTPINSLQIVMGKLLSRLLQLVPLLVISLPMLAIVRVLGGVPWGYLLSGLCITLTAAIFAGSLSLLFSIRNRHAYGVIIRTMSVLACLYFVLPALFGLAAAYFFSRGGINLGARAGAMTVLGPIVVSLNPISSMAAITERMFSPAGPGMFSLPVHCGFMLMLSALVLGRAMAVVRKVALRQAVGIVDGGVRTADSRGKVNPQSAIRNPKSGGVRRVVGPPVVWKELRAPFIQGIDNRNSYIGLAMAIVALVFTYWSAAQAKSLNEDFTHITYVMLFVFIGGLINIVFSATRITTEKESQAWPLLLTTPLSDWDILFGKAVSAFRRCLPIWGLLAGHVLLFTLAGYIHPVAILHLLALVAWLTCFITGSGLYFSARFARTTSAVVASLAVVVGLWVVGPILAGLMGVMGGKTDVLATYLWVHPAVQTQLIVGGAAGWQNARMSWGSLNYATGALFHSGGEVMRVGRVTGILTAIAAAYILAGLVFFWRAKCCLRRRIF